MSLEITVPDSDYSTQIVTLGNTQFQIELKWKERTQRWYFSLTDMSDKRLVSERKLLNAMTPTGPFQLRGFDGAIIVEKNFGRNEQPTRDNFGHGKEFSLLYLTETETNMLLGG